MLESATTPQTPDWWLLRLGKRLEDDRPRLGQLDDYWRGDHPLPFGNRKMREAYRRFQAMSRTNFMLLVAESVIERLKVVGFRAGSDATDKTDKKAWGWWQENDLDSVSGLVHRAAVVMSRAYVMVGEDPDHPGRPLVTGEDPRQVIHEESPLNRRKILAVLKSFWDEIREKHVAVVYLDDGSVHYYTAARKTPDTDSQLWTAAQWSQDEESARSRLGRPPFVVFRNRPDLMGLTLGEFEGETHIQDRINTQVLDRMVISTMQAYRQRYATGVETRDEDGQPTLGFDPGADLLWAVSDEKAKFGDFTQADLAGILRSVESDVAHLGAITRTPPHYLLGSIVNASGDALAQGETGLVSKIGERMQEYGTSWEQVYRMAGQIIGDDIPQDAEVLWQDPEFRTLAELAAASVQLVAAGVPWRTRMTKLGMTPQEIDRMQVERAQDAMLEASLNPAVTPATPNVPDVHIAPQRTPPQPTGTGGTFSMRNGPGSGQGRAAGQAAARAKAGR